MNTPAIRDATGSDVERLLALEELSFGSDRISRRSFRHFLRAPTARLRLAGSEGTLDGYYLMLFRAGSTVGRLYSIAVAAEARGRGIATALLMDAATEALARGADRISLEVREDNSAAIRLYESLGYAERARIGGYYEDGADARRYEKRLDRRPSAKSGTVER